MGYTGAYSRIYRLDEDGEPCSCAPKILDMDAFDAAAEEIEVQCDISADTLKNIAIFRERTDRSSYPEQTFKHLWGFKSWTPRDCFGLTEYNEPSDFDGVHDLFSRVEEVLDKHREDYSTGGLGYNCNIERFAIPYGTMPERVARLFALISTATEPFVLWHTDKANDMPDLGRMDANSVDEDVVYRIECRDGAAEIHKVTFERTGEEKLVDIDQREDDS